MKLIGIGGTNGAGKDTVGEILSERHGWLVISVSDFLRQEAKERGLPIEREHLRSISAEWRRKHGLSVLTDKAIELYKEAGKKHAGLAVVPMRNPGEAQRVKDLGGVLVWVDADPKVRYQRIKSRDRSTEDKKTYRQFMDEEQAEIHHHGGDPATLSVYKVRTMSDIFLENNGNDIEAFKNESEEALRHVIGS